MESTCKLDWELDYNKSKIFVAELDYQLTGECKQSYKRIQKETSAIKMRVEYLRQQSLKLMRDILLKSEKYSLSLVRPPNAPFLKWATSPHIEKRDAEPLSLSQTLTEIFTTKCPKNLNEPY